MRMTRMLARMHRCGVLLAVVAASATAQEQEARGKMVLTPYAGVFVPSTDVAQFDLGAGSSSISAALKQKTGFALGATGNYWLNDRFAIELGGAYVMSDAKGTVALDDPTGGFFGSEAQSAHLWLGTAKLMMNLMPATSDFRLRLGVGPAIINRGGPAYKSDEETKVSGLTDFGGAVSLCTRIPIAGAIAVRLRGETYLYQSQLKIVDRSDPGSSFNFDRRFQSDFVFSAGLQFGFSR